MSIQVAFKEGERPLSLKFGVPSSWISRDSVLHSNDYNISIRDLDNVKKRVTQEGYWFKNSDRAGLIEFDFEDRWIESEWVRFGIKKGKEGEFWCPGKLDILQESLERNLIIPDSFLSMKDIKKLFGVWATKDKVEEAGFQVSYGRKKGKPGRAGYFVSSEILQDSRSVSNSDGLIPVRQVFYVFPHISLEDIPQIVAENKVTGGKKRKLQMKEGAFREDFMIKKASLVALEANGIDQNSTKQLRTRQVTAVDVSGGTSTTRQLIRARVRSEKEERRKARASAEQDNYMRE